MRKILALALLVGLALPQHQALAACAATITVKDGTGASITTCDTTDGGTGLVPSVGLLGGANNANKLTIDANGGGGVNLLDVGGTAISTGTGAVGSGTPRVAIGVDAATIGGSAPSTKLLVTPDSVALPANQSVNEAQINGVTPLMGNGVSGTGAQRVIIGSDNSAVSGLGVAATAGAPPANAVYQGASASGVLTGVVSCDSHVFKHITTATDTLAVQGVTAKTIKVCGVLAVFAGTATVFLENTASTNANCSSSNTQIAGLMTGTAQSVQGFYSPFWGGLANTSANGLCINSTGTGGVDIDIWYTSGS